MTDAPVAMTFFTDYAATTNRREALTFKEFAGRVAIASAPTKAALPWVKLAIFGDVRTAQGSLRHNDNILEVTGLEADYDAEKISFDTAIEIVEKAGLEALLYTSPSHRREGHGDRWRILCRLATPCPPDRREYFLARLGGLFRDGNVTALAGESWTRSQAYYFGAVDHNPEHRVKLVEGATLDELAELDLIALGKPGAGGAASDTAPHWSAAPQAELADIRAALAAIPNDFVSWIRWNQLGLAVFAASGGSGRGYALFSSWSRRSARYDKDETKDRWKHYRRSPPGQIGFGSLAHWARQAVPGWAKLSTKPKPAPPDTQEAGPTPGPTPRATPIGSLDWYHKCIAGQDGRTLSNLANALLGLREDLVWQGVFSRNGLLDAPILNYPPALWRGNAGADYPRPVTDEDVTSVQEWLHRRGSRRSPKT